MSAPHNKIIAAAAKAELAPLGFKRQGQSRLWLKDHGFWLNIVEFTPSAWSVSVAITNGTHWLWGGCGFMSFNHCVRSEPRIEFKDDQQFRDEVCDIARLAAKEAAKIDGEFSSLEAIAKHVIDEAQKSDRMRPSWFGYYAGVASGLLGDLEDAEQFLRGITDSRVSPYAERFLAVIDSATGFRQKANEVLSQQRIDLKLPPLEKPYY